MEHAGRWVAWDRKEKRAIAIADTYAAVMNQVEAAGTEDPVVKRIAGVHPDTVQPPFTLLEGESPQIIDDIRTMIPDAERWLDTPHIRFVGRKPRQLIGTEDEQELRQFLRGIRYGITA